VSGNRIASPLCKENESMSTVHAGGSMVLSPLCTENESLPHCGEKIRANLVHFENKIASSVTRVNKIELSYPGKQDSELSDPGKQDS